MTEVGAPIVAAMSEADEATQTRIKDQTFARIRQQCPGDKVALAFGALVLSGEK